MDVRFTRRGVPASFLWGALGISVWAALTVVLGGGTAHADETDEGPLSPLTSLVGDTVSAVTKPVAPVVTQVVAPVVTQVVAPVVTQVVAPVQQAAPAVAAPVAAVVHQVPVVAPVVAATTQTVEAVVAPVTQVISDAPVSHITAPVVAAVGGLPVIGTLLDDLGVIDLVETVTGVVDDAAAVIGGATEETVEPVVGALNPDVAESESTTGTTGSPLIDVATATSGMNATSDARASAPSAREVIAALGEESPAVLEAVVDGAHAPGTPADGPPAAPSAPTSSAGSGGASPLAHARLSDVGVPPFPTWEWNSGATDDALPSSAVADTDVSPD